MNRDLLIGIIVIAIIAGGVLFYGMGSTSPTSTQASVYCGEGGTLTDTPPIQSHRSYCFKTSSNTSGLESNTPAPFSYSIIDDQGNTLKDLDTVHQKIMHFIVVRKDLANFQHVHPDFNPATGEFTLSNLTYPSDGEYRLFADFTPAASMMSHGDVKLPVTLSRDLQVGNLANYKLQALGATTDSKTVGGYQVKLPTVASLETGKESTLMFDIKQNGKSITDLQPYLGALGHVVILRGDDLQFIHAHPLQSATDKQTGAVHFMVPFAEAGKYKVFLQFQREEKISTADFVVDVARGAGSSDGMTPSVQH